MIFRQQGYDTAIFTKKLSKCYFVLCILPGTKFREIRLEA